MVDWCWASVMAFKSWCAWACCQRWAGSRGNKKPRSRPMIRVNLRIAGCTYAWIAQCPSPFLQGIDRLYLPVRHGEGKFVPRDASVLQALQANHQIAARYCGPDGSAGTVSRGTPMALSMILPQCVIPAAAFLASCRILRRMCTIPITHAGRGKLSRRKAWACTSVVTP